MDGCSKIAGESSRVKNHFESLISHFNYTYCRNHFLALCFVYLISKYENFQKLHSLLLNLCLLFKNSSLNQSISEELQSSYGSYEMIKPTGIATVCFLADILKARIVLRTVLQGSRLNYLKNLVKILNAKAGASEKTTGCFFSQMISLI